MYWTQEKNDLLKKIITEWIEYNSSQQFYKYLADRFNNMTGPNETKYLPNSLCRYVKQNDFFGERERIRTIFAQKRSIARSTRCDIWKDYDVIVLKKAIKLTKITYFKSHNKEKGIMEEIYCNYNKINTNSQNSASKTRLYNKIFYEPKLKKEYKKLQQYISDKKHYKAKNEAQYLKNKTQHFSENAQTNINENYININQSYNDQIYNDITTTQKYGGSNILSKDMRSSQTQELSDLDFSLFNPDVIDDSWTENYKKTQQETKSIQAVQFNSISF